MPTFWLSCTMWNPCFIKMVFIDALPWNFKKKKGCQLFSCLLKTEGTFKKKRLDKNGNGATLWTKQEVFLLLRSLGKVPLVRPAQHVMQMDKVWTAGDRNLKCHQRPPAMMFRNTEMFLIWSEVFFSRREAFVVMKVSIVSMRNASMRNPNCRVE